MSKELELLKSSISRDLEEIFSAETMEDAVRVTTHCMFPSNGFIRVTLRGGANTIVASDEGETVGEALSAGISLRNPDILLRSIVRAQGLDIKNGVIHTPPMPTSSAPLAIALVSNVAKEAAFWLYDHQKIRRDRDFRQLLATFLKKTFDERVTPAKIVGVSTKAHKFANVVSFANGKRLIIDAVANDPSSINARVVANLDVRSVNDPSLDQRIIYDDDENWSASDLNLLNVGAAAIPFSRSNEVIQRVASQVAAA